MSEETPDAWKQMYDLHATYTKEWEVRTDLKVTALACERGVRFALADPGYISGRPRSWHDTQRNVSTMRELAQALLDACDFVEAANPTWARQFPEGHLERRVTPGAVAFPHARPPDESPAGSPRD